MFKHSKWIAAIAAIVFLFSGFNFIADAAVVNGKNDRDAKVYELKTGQKTYQLHDQDVERLINKFYTQCKSYLNKDHKHKKSYYKKYKHHVKQPGKKEQPVNEDQPKEVEQPVDEENKVDTPVTPTEPVEKQPEEQAKPNEEPVVETPAQEEQVEQPAEKQEDPANYALNEFEQRVFQLTNEARANHGLAPLQIDLELSKVAREKSRDMAVNRYFSHTSPVYGSPFDMMRAYGISYRTAGENIAKGQRTPEEVVNAWMNSPGHRANILNSSFTHIGIGYVAEGNHWTQQFIGK